MLLLVEVFQNQFPLHAQTIDEHSSVESSIIHLPHPVSVQRRLDAATFLTGHACSIDDISTRIVDFEICFEMKESGPLLFINSCFFPQLISQLPSCPTPRPQSKGAQYLKASVVSKWFMSARAGDHPLPRSPYKVCVLPRETEKYLSIHRVNVRDKREGNLTNVVAGEQQDERCNPRSIYTCKSRSKSFSDEPTIVPRQ